MPTVFCIRHGESQSNAGQATTRSEKIALTEQGQRQAESVARALGAFQIYPDLLVYSSYLRTKQTARWTQQLWPDVPSVEWPVHEFNYLASWRTRPSTREERRQSVVDYWTRADPAFIESPGAESFAVFIQRARSILTHLKESNNKCVVIFSHEQFISALLWLLQENPAQISTQSMQRFRAFVVKLSLANGAIVRLQLPGNGCYEVETKHLLR